MIKQKQQQIHPFGESGFTIIESLVAMLVVSILLAAIAPTIVIATATRVQSKRVEQATQAARTFIDGVKTGAVTAPTTTIEPNGTLAGNLFTTTNMPVPGQASTPLTSLYCVRKDGNNNLVIIDPDCTSNTDKIFYIQAVKIVLTGSNPIDSTGLPKDGYRLGIRVYRADIDLTKTVKASDASIAASPKQHKTLSLALWAIANLH